MLYTVRYGDSLNSIAAAHGVSPAALSTANQLDSHIKPVAGLSLIIPDEHEPKQRTIIHGCIPPCVGETALISAAPYLNCISICSCYVQADGSINSINDHPILSRTRSLGISSLLNITNQRQGGDFSGNALHSLFCNDYAKKRFTDTIVQYLLNNKYAGANIEFDDISFEDLRAYVDFIQIISESLHRHDLRLFVTMSKISDVFPSICGYADRVIMLTQDRYSAFHSPSAICPIEDTRCTLEKAVDMCDTGKLLLSLPCYGCNWVLPYHGNAARIVYLGEIPSLAYRHFADIRYDDKVQAPHFSYYDSAGTEHMVWFHDPRSISARLKLAEEYNLGGVSLGTIAPFYRPGWITLGDMYKPEKTL